MAAEQTRCINPLGRSVSVSNPNDPSLFRASGRIINAQRITGQTALDSGGPDGDKSLPEFGFVRTLHQFGARERC